jgi:hypothetical protein
MENILNSIDSCNRSYSLKIFICDTNIDCLKESKNRTIFLDMFYQYGYEQIIEEPTYPINYDENKSLIDLVFISNKEKIISKYLIK